MDGDPMQPTTVEQFLSLFEVDRGHQGGSQSIASVFENSLRASVGNTNPNTSCASSEDEERGRTDIHNARTWKALFEKIGHLERSHSNGEA